MIDPLVFTSSRKMTRGETSMKRARRNKKRGCIKLGVSPRLSSSNLSNSISDFNIYNCNRRIKVQESGSEEIRL